MDIIYVTISNIPDLLRMAELGLDPQERVLCFAQLLGMCDQITFPLGKPQNMYYLL